MFRLHLIFNAKSLLSICISNDSTKKLAKFPKLTWNLARRSYLIDLRWFLDLSVSHSTCKHREPPQHTCLLFFDRIFFSLFFNLSGCLLMPSVECTHKKYVTKIILKFYFVNFFLYLFHICLPWRHFITHIYTWIDTEIMKHCPIFFFLVVKLFYVNASWEFLCLYIFFISIVCLLAPHIIKII